MTQVQSQAYTRVMISMPVIVLIRHNYLRSVHVVMLMNGMTVCMLAMTSAIVPATVPLFHLVARVIYHVISMMRAGMVLVMMALMLDSNMFSGVDCILAATTICQCCTLYDQQARGQCQGDG